MSKYLPNIGGDDFEGMKCSLDHKLRDSGNQSPKPFVVKTVLISSVGALAVSGAYGLFTADWTPVTQVYLVVSAPVAAIIATHIGNGDSEE